jgi:hypothetical protein
MPANVVTVVHILGHGVSGACSLIGVILNGFEAADPDPAGSWGIPSAVCSIVGGIFQAVANELVPHDPLEDEIVSGISLAFTGIRILCKVCFATCVQKKIASISSGEYNVEDYRGVGAVIDAALVFGSLFGSICHFMQLARQPDNGDRTIAILDETSTLLNDVYRISYAVAVNTEAIPRAAAIVVMSVAGVCQGGLQIAECMIE